MLSRRITKTCLNCGEDFTIPLSRDWREHCCSTCCKREYKEKKNQEDRNLRRRECETCGQVFYPRWTQIRIGQGRYCSNRCSIPYIVGCAHTDEVNERRAKAIRKAIAEGRKPPLCGPDNPKWKGGREAYRKRQIRSGAQARRLRRYRYLNPDKVREWDQRRKNGSTGPLPYGTIPKLRSLQRNRCACCGINLSKAYHIDHIVPIAKGGKHEAENIQLLCPSCNLHKSAKDPVDYMQELGRLL